MKKNKMETRKTGKRMDNGRGVIEIYEKGERKREASAGDMEKKKKRELKNDYSIYHLTTV